MKPATGRLIFHPWERLTGPTTFRSQWTPAKAARVAFRTGQGRTSPNIAAELADGTLPATIRAMWKKWRLPGSGSSVAVPVPMSAEIRSLLATRAATAGLTPDQWCAKVLDFAIRDDLYRAIVPTKPKTEDIDKRKLQKICLHET